MAESAVKSAAEWLGKLLVEEGKYLWGAEDKIEELQDELLWMQSFLRNADTVQHDDEIVRMWVLKIKEYVAEAEDIIDNFVIKVVSSRRQTGWVNKLKRYSCFLKELVALHKVASGIDSLKAKISMLSPRLERYGLKTSYGMKTYRAREAQAEQVQQSLKYRHLEREKIIGLDENAKQIADALQKSGTRRWVVAIHGMGGLGKSTLATKVFHDDEIKKHFPGGRAWAYISQKFHVQSVLRALLAELTMNSIDFFAKKDVKELIPELRELLKKKKCLVVLDDVWNKRDWDVLRAAFTTCGGESGSRVLLTTRKEEVAKYVDEHAFHKPDPLSDEESWELLLQNVGWLRSECVEGSEAGLQERDRHASAESENSGSSTADTSITNGHERAKNLTAEGSKADICISGGQERAKTGNFQSEGVPGSDGHVRAQNKKVNSKDALAFTTLGKEIVKHCDGLPLAVILLAGILRKKETLNEWQLVHDNFISYLRRGNEQTSYMEVLVQSYNDLPYHLKSCFLHLGNYPEDYEICTEQLYWVWMAEGLVTWPHDRIAGTDSLEDIADSYLSDLAQAGMVEVMKKRSDGRIRSIRMHDLMRDVSLQKAVAENFINVIDHRSYPDKPLSITSNFSRKRLLRMAIYLADGTKSFVPDSLSSKAHMYLRSLLFFAGHGTEKDDGSSSADTFSSVCHRCLGPLSSIIKLGSEQHKYQRWMECICSDFLWLRVLDIEGFRLEGRLTNQIQNLIHLRYLSLKNTKVSDLPSSIGNLKFLEILDLRVSSSTSMVKMPNTLWKLDRLSHLLLPSISYEVKLSKKLRLDTLICLNVLKNLEVSNSRLQDLQNFETLRKLSFKGIVSDVGSLDYILRIPALKSRHFQGCSLGVEGNVISEKRNVLSAYDCIHRLYISEKVSARLEDVEFPRLLKVLHLKSCRLENDPMKTLGSLPHLKDLLLNVNSFVGKKIICESESFRSLKTLGFRGLVDLEDWTVEEGSMPSLKILRIWKCGKLKRIPRVRPESVHVTCSPCISGIEQYGTCVYHNANSAVGSHEEVITGLQDDADFLASKVLDSEHSIIVLSGRPGIGKDTLVQTLCRRSDIRRHFDASAWAYTTWRCSISEPYATPSRSTLLGVLRDLAPEISNDVLSQTSSDDLVEVIQQLLVQKKSLLILTTYLKPDSVARLILTFGYKCFENGSKLLLIPNATDAKKDGLRYVEEVFCTLRTLGMDRRMKVLPSKMMAQNRLIVQHLNFSKQEQMQTLFHQQCMDILEGNDALLKEQTAKKMMQQCSGNLLSIRMLAALLATKKTLVEWGTIFKDLSSIQSGYDQPLSRIFSLNYKDLPLHLRRCFLYLANFPQDSEVSTEKLFRLWIAAGFVRLQDDIDQTDEFLENLAESYLAELVQRGMVKVRRRGATGRIKRCRLQFALYNLCLEKAREEGFRTIVDQSFSSASSTLNVGLTTRHLAIHMNGEEDNIIPLSISSDDDRLNSIESLSYFSSVGDSNCKEERWDWFITICDSFKSLQVLDLEGVWKIKGSLPVAVENLTQLRYLSLKGTWVSVLPYSVGKLANLQTLDLRVLEPIFIPDVLWKLKYLRHLHLPDSINVQTGKLKLHGLDHLQTLSNICTIKVDLNHVYELKALRKISVRMIHKVKELDVIIKSLDTFVDLTINSESIGHDDPNILSRLQNLHKVRVKGPLVGLQSQMFPALLKELTLKHTKLKEDPIPVLEKLPNLRRLFFDHDSFLGNSMTFSGDFRHLTHLSFRLLSNLEELNNPGSNMRVLESLVIIDCWRLQEEKVEIKSDDMLLRFR